MEKETENSVSTGIVESSDSEAEEQCTNDQQLLGINYANESLDSSCDECAELASLERNEGVTDEMKTVCETSTSEHSSHRILEVDSLENSVENLVTNNSREENRPIEQARSSGHDPSSESELNIKETGNTGFPHEEVDQSKNGGNDIDHSHDGDKSVADLIDFDTTDNIEDKSDNIDSNDDSAHAQSDNDVVSDGDNVEGEDTVDTKECDNDDVDDDVDDNDYDSTDIDMVDGSDRIVVDNDDSDNDSDSERNIAKNFELLAADETMNSSSLSDDRMHRLESELHRPYPIFMKPRRMSTGQLALAKTNYHQFATRRASEDSLLEPAKDLKSQMVELDEKYKKAMLTNAQLDNEKQMFKYQVENLKDVIEDLEEVNTETHRQYKEKSRECEFEKRTKKDLERETACLKEQIKKRDALIAEHGLVIVGRDEIMTKDGFKIVSEATLLSVETAQFLEEAGEGSLDDRLKVFVEEKKELEEEVKRLKEELETARETNQLALKYGAPESSPKMNGPDVVEIQREASRQVSDYEFKLSKAEQDISSLESNVVRLEGQVKRYKTAAEEAEHVEEELKSEKRKITRELRESQTLIEELQSQNGHLQKRLEKLKSSRNQLLK